jgi:ribonuclease HI
MRWEPLGKIYKKLKFNFTNNKLQQIMNIRVFTDGSCTNNHKLHETRSGGIGIYYENNIFPSISQPYLQENPTNQNTELTAFLLAIKNIISEKIKCGLNIAKITVVTDSKYMINVVTKWMKEWKRLGWVKKDKKEIKNLSIIKEIDNMLQYCEKLKLPITFLHQNSHLPEPDKKNIEKWNLWKGNDIADKLAKKGGS